MTPSLKLEIKKIILIEQNQKRFTIYYLIKKRSSLWHIRKHKIKIVFFLIRFGGPQTATFVSQRNLFTKIAKIRVIGKKILVLFQFYFLIDLILQVYSKAFSWIILKSKLNVQPKKIIIFIYFNNNLIEELRIKYVFVWF